MQEQITLVLGGTGKTGRRVVERLEQNGLPYRVGSRKAPIPFDWSHPSTWKPALNSVSSVYLAFAPDLAVPGTDRVIADFVSTAKAEGVTHITLLSGRGEPEASVCENQVIQSGLSWNVLRCSWFFQNFSESFLLDDIQSGAVHLPVGDVQEPFIDAEDIADVAYSTLTDPQKHGGRVYEMTGADLLTFEDAIKQIGHASGYSVQFQTIPLEVYTTELNKAGIPREMIELTSYLFTEVMDGRNASLARGIQEALGRPPRSFADYVQRTAKTGVWTPR